MNFTEITSEELDIYITRLVPRLMRLPPGEWIEIEDIAKDTGRFIDICQCLTLHGYLLDGEGFPLVDIREDRLVRLNPCFLRNHKRKSPKKWN